MYKIVILRCKVVRGERDSTALFRRLLLDKKNFCSQVKLRQFYLCYRILTNK